MPRGATSVPRVRNRLESKHPDTSFSPVPYAAEHLLAHHETDELGELNEDRGPPPRVRVTLPDQEPGHPVRLLAKHEGPGEVVGRRDVAHLHPAAKDERSPRLDGGNLQGDFRMQPDLIPNLDALPLRRDVIRAVDVAADHVLEGVVAVEAAPP